MIAFTSRARLGSRRRAPRLLGLPPSWTAEQSPELSPPGFGLERDRGQELNAVGIDSDPAVGRALRHRLADPGAARLVLHHDE